ncbi:hypothetical protein ED236_00800 [Pseudomethylobacillus aquaticus]|uniref:DUF3185 domain-containing protein n=1 Tax=Pseudomethylobacillus aquaticus TaxID=2676064 RepID=A0A3N0V5H3_9PROT|nr:hypothetical protein [Pseudomethylobacillus aquaticus]ROH88057.1 hypothetical protein ED236_00800 [Pseudomethylobacillus aquaticus]
MKASIVVGCLLIVLGAAGLVYKSFNYSSEETVVQIGELKATAEIEKEVEVPTALSLVALAAGLAALFIGMRSK